MIDAKTKRTKKITFNALREIELFLSIEGSIKLRFEKEMFIGSSSDAILDYSNYEIIYNIDALNDYMIDEVYISVIMNVRNIYHRIEIELKDEKNLLKRKDSSTDIDIFKKEFENGKFKFKDSFSYIDSFAFTKLYMELYLSKVIPVDDLIYEKVKDRCVELLKLFKD